MTAIKINDTLFALLKRCGEIEGRSINDIVNSLLQPYLAKYSYNTLEEWELAKDALEMEEMLLQYGKESGFDPNYIPFNKQIMGLRKKLDELDREIAAKKSTDPELLKLRFSIIEDLNFAEKEALEKEQSARTLKSERWKKVCRNIPINSERA